MARPQVARADEPERFTIHLEEGTGAVRVALGEGAEIEIHPGQKYVSEQQGQEWGELRLFGN